MIEEKELGLKVAENKEEKFWTEAKKKCEDAIESAGKEILINSHILKLCKEMLGNRNDKTKSI